jgi:hypothetical protein
MCCERVLQCSACYLACLSGGRSWCAAPFYRAAEGSCQGGRGRMGKAVEASGQHAPLAASGLESTAESRRRRGCSSGLSTFLEHSRTLRKADSRQPNFKSGPGPFGVPSKPQNRGPTMNQASDYARKSFQAEAEPYLWP